MDMRNTSIEGVVVQEVVSPGSKSEHLAYVLRAKTGETYTLRREGNLSFVDQGLAPLVGHSIKAEGLIADHLFIIRKWEPTD
jgi:hypothetical protein